MIKAIIFDMDGTLVDSLSVWVEADRRFLKSLGIEHTFEVSYSMKNMHFEEACRYLINEFSLTLTLEEVFDGIIKNVQDLYLTDVELKPNVAEYLKSQQEKGLKMCVATSNNKRLAQKCLERLDVAKYFDFVLTSDEVGTSKDNPEIFIKSAEMLGFKPSEIMVFEDSLHAVKSAVLAGFYVVGIRDDYSNDEFEQLQKTAHKTIHNFEEMLQNEDLCLQNKQFF